MAMEALKELREHLAKEDEKFEEEMKAFTVPGFPSGEEWQPTPKQIEIIRILKETPMLTDWLLTTLVAKVQEINTAVLRTMYSEEQLKALADAHLNVETED